MTTKPGPPSFPPPSWPFFSPAWCLKWSPPSPCGERCGTCRILHDRQSARAGRADKARATQSDARSGERALLGSVPTLAPAGHGRRRGIVRHSTQHQQEFPSVARRAICPPICTRDPFGESTSSCSRTGAVAIRRPGRGPRSSGRDRSDPGPYQRSRRVISSKGLGRVTVNHAARLGWRPVSESRWNGDFRHFDCRRGTFVSTLSSGSRSSVCREGCWDAKLSDMGRLSMRFWPM